MTVVPSCIKYSAFADDISIYVEYPRDYHALKGILEVFGKAFNSNIDIDESVIYPTTTGNSLAETRSVDFQ